MCTSGQSLNVSPQSSVSRLTLHLCLASWLQVRLTLCVGMLGPSHSHLPACVTCGQHCCIHATNCELSLSHTHTSQEKTRVGCTVSHGKVLLWFYLCVKEHTPTLRYKCGHIPHTPTRMYPPEAAFVSTPYWCRPYEASVNGVSSLSFLPDWRCVSSSRGC